MQGSCHLPLQIWEMDIAEQISCSVLQEGACTVPAHLFYDIVRKLPDGAEVEVSVADGNASIKAGRSAFTLCRPLPIEDFPAFNVSELPVQFSLTTADMRHQIDTTRLLSRMRKRAII